MDKARDVRRRRHFTKRSPNFSSAGLAGGEVLATQKTRIKERFQKLSLVDRANPSFPDGEKPMGPSDVSDREEELRAVVGRKRLQLPRKFLEDCHTVKQASVPRKLRSAMKKRSQESLSPSMPTSKKPKSSTRRGESHRTDGARKTKKQGRSEMVFSGSITKDEEEVAETLYSLAGMFLNNNSACNGGGADEESSRADTSAFPGGAETLTNSACEDKKEELKPSVPSYNEERLSEEITRTHFNDGHTTGRPCKEADSWRETDLQSTTSHSHRDTSNRELHASWNFGFAAELALDAHVNQPEKIGTVRPSCKQEHKDVTVEVNGNQLDIHHKIKERRDNGPVLWPGLLTASGTPQDSDPLQLYTSKIPMWINGAACSTKPRPMESRIPMEKVSKSRVHKISQKKCMKHVFISHLIKTLQMPVNKRETVLQPNPGPQLEEMEQSANREVPKFNFLKNSSSRAFSGMVVSDSPRNETRNAIPQQNRCSQGPKSSSLEKEGFNFLSLSTSVTASNQKPNSPYLYSIAQQQHMSVPLPTSKGYYSNSRPDQLSGVITSRQVQLQSPTYLGNSGRPSFHRGSIILPKEQQQHQQMLWAGQIASNQFKPTWQNRRIESHGVVPFTAIIPPPLQSPVEVLGPKYPQLLSQQQLLHHQQQQFISIRSSFLPSIGKRQETHPHSAHEETIPRFHGGGALSLQLLCNEHL